MKSSRNRTRSKNSVKKSEVHLEHLDPRNHSLVCGLKNDFNEVFSDGKYNCSKGDYFLPYRVKNFQAPVNPGDLGEFLIQGEWVITDFMGEWFCHEALKFSARRFSPETEKERFRVWEEKISNYEKEKDCKIIVCSWDGSISKRSLSRRMCKHCTSKVAPIWTLVKGAYCCQYASNKVSSSLGVRALEDMCKRNPKLRSEISSKAGSTRSKNRPIKEVDIELEEVRRKEVHNKRVEQGRKLAKEQSVEDKRRGGKNAMSLLSRDERVERAKLMASKVNPEKRRVAAVETARKKLQDNPNHFKEMGKSARESESREVRSRRGHSIPKDAKRKGREKTNSTLCKCLVTGKISTPGPLTLYQRSRGIDTSLREVIN